VRERPTPLGAIGRGLVAGAIGTAAMTAWQTLAAKLQESGEESEGSSSEGSSAEEKKDPWEEASAPAKVAKRVLEGVFQEQVGPERIGFLTEAMHWGYGTSWGAAYGVLAGTAGRSTLRGGLAFGTGVWASSYAQLVPMGLYEPPWKYPPKTLALDLSYHLVYGSAVAAAYRLLP
jgi:hypothetical protein